METPKNEIFRDSIGTIPMKKASVLGYFQKNPVESSIITGNGLVMDYWFFCVVLHL